MAVKYLLMIYMNESLFESLTDEERNAVFAGHNEFIPRIQESGEFVGTAGLVNPTQSKTVRVRDGVTTATDGPYIETKEYLAGYYAIDCESLDRAIELAAMIPDAALTAIEVRPVMVESGLEI
jgi:hypothetical protein